MGLWEAPRGALLHTEKVNNGKITDYQIIIPTTWNIAPRNAEGVQGPDGTGSYWHPRCRR